MNSTAVINLRKLDHNVNAIRSKLKDGVKLMAVVKDNAYGHGAVEVARRLQDKTEWFCVSQIHEALQLRNAGITNPVLVFETPNKEHVPLYVDYDLTATVGEISTLDILQKGTSYHVNIDTGMHRLGILPSGVSDLIDAIASHPELNFDGIYSHFATADDPESKKVYEQLALFKDIRAQFPSHIFTHFANSGAIFHYGDEFLFDAVRPGISLYGYAPGSVNIPELEPILDWKSFLMQVKYVYEGEGIGYGTRGVAPEDGWLGVIPVGYGDGVFRLLSGKIGILINGIRYPQIGTIAMDFMMVFLGRDELKKGAEVFLLKGKELSAKTWADIAHTIPYEITLGINHRVRYEFVD